MPAPDVSAASRRYPGIRAPLHPLQHRCASSPYSPGTPSLPRLAGAAHRRSRCVRIFARRYTRARRGFTLLELVIALAILAMIAGSVAAGIRLAVASIERGETVTRDAARLRAAVEIFERALMSADPLPIPVGDNTTAYFAGEEKSVRFLTAGAPSAAHGGGLWLISFFERRDGEGSGIAVATASPFRAEGAEGWEGTEKARILVPGGGSSASPTPRARRRKGRGSGSRRGTRGRRGAFPPPCGWSSACRPRPVPGRPRSWSRCPPGEEPADERGP